MTYNGNTKTKKGPCLAERCRAEILKACSSPADFQEANGRVSRFITGARAVFESVGTPLPYVEREGLDGVYRMADDSIAAVYRDRIDVAAEPSEAWTLPDQRFVAVVNHENPRGLDDLLDAAAKEQVGSELRPQGSFKPPETLQEAKDLLKAMDSGNFTGDVRYANEYGIPLSEARAEIRQSAALIIDAHNAIKNRIVKKRMNVTGKQPEPDTGPEPSGA